MNPDSRLADFADPRGLAGLTCAVFDASGFELQAHRLRAEELLPIASVTKTFTAELILRAAARQQLSLDAPIAEQLPGFALADPDASRHLTPRDALCHFSGLPPHTWAWVYGDLSRDRFLRERLPHLAATGPFRAEHRYSNLLYAVLGQLLEARTGLSWEQALHDHIQLPLELRSLRTLDEHWATACAAPNRRVKGQPQPMPPFAARAHHPIAPASELACSLPDLVRWGQYQLAPPPHDERWRPHNRVSDTPSHPLLSPTDYGLGWRIDHLHGQRRVWHSGQCSGFTALLSLYPDQQRGFAALTNTDSALPELLALELHLLHKQPLSLPAPPPPPHPSAPTSHHAPPPKPGLYHHPGYGTLLIEQNGPTLCAQYQNAPATPLETAPGGGKLLVLPGYLPRFPITPTQMGLELPFEPRVAPIAFQRVR